MGQAAVEAFLDLYLNDPDFRVAFARDPEGAVRREGISLDAGEIEALHNSHVMKGNEPLKARVNRGAFGLGS